jgi:outer membrane receptor for ferrienterochelin and colicins
VQLLADPAGAGAVWAADASGQFALPSAAPATVRVSAVGFAAAVFTTDTLPSGTVQLAPATYAIPQAVVTGQYGLRNDVDAVQPVQVLDRRAIDRVAAVTLRDVLATQTNLTLGYDGQIGSTVRMLGLSGQHVQVLVDGVPVIGRLDGNIDLDQLPLDAVERIEVIEGPMSVEYGSEAIAGTINLITRSAGSSPRAEVRAVAESIQRLTTSVQYATPIGKSTRLNGRASRLYFGGGNPPDRSGRELLWKPKEQLSASLGLAHDFGGLTWSVGADGMWETLWNDGPVEYVTTTVAIDDSLLGVYRTPVARDGVFTTRREVVRTDVEGEVGGMRVDGFASFTRYWRDRRTYSRDLVDLSREPLYAEGMNDTAEFRTWQSRVSVVRPFGERLEASLGYDVSREVASGSRLGVDRPAMQQAALFGSVEWRPTPRLIVRPGVRAEYNAVFGAPVVPSLHVKWTRGSHAVRASYARGFRAPELKELYFRFVDFNHNIQGNPDLEAEFSNSFTASYTLRKLTDRALISPSIRLFHNEVVQLIDLALVDSETQSYTYINLGQVRTAGIGLGLERSGDRASWRVQATGVDRQTWFETDGTPEGNRSLQASASCDVRIPGEVVLTAQTNYAHNETIVQPDGTGGWAQATLSPITLVSLYAARSWMNSRLAVTGGVDNLLGATTRTLSGETVGTGGIHSAAAGSQPVSLGRNFRFTLQFTF